MYALTIVSTIVLLLSAVSPCGSSSGSTSAPVLPATSTAVSAVLKTAHYNSAEAEEWIARHEPTLLTQPQLQSLYESLINGYWVPQTGLFLSFPGTGDPRLEQQAATYDQGIVGILLLELGEIDKVRQMLRFYEAAWYRFDQRSGPRKGKGGFANFYNAYYSVEGVEKTMHVGPNAWIGLLAARYYRQTEDPDALHLAMDIAHWMMDRVPHSDGAIAMGEIPWNSAPWDRIYSTENNLSTLAFLSELLKAKGLPARDRRDLVAERFRIERWLVHQAYNPVTGKVIRGFHPGGTDSVGAIDSYTWFLASLRPARLRSQRIDPERLMQFASQEFTVDVDGKKGIDCIDQGMADATFKDDVFKQTNDALFLRPAKDGHRLIWYEGQGQYIVATLDLARQLVTQAFSTTDPALRRRDLNQAGHWFSVAQEMTQAMDDASFPMPWGKAYPCATNGRFYLYGWPAPQATKDHLSDAVAPLVWRLFSGMGFEPLSGTHLSAKGRWHVAAIAGPTMHDPHTDILYGASEEMVVRAWQLLESGDRVLAQRQAQSTITMWEKDAIALELSKEKRVGTYLPYDGTIISMQKIHDYWALNDVAAAYYIIGKIAHEAQDFPAANAAFGAILKKFSLAQMWDTRGWFWNPVESIQLEYIGAEPEHYGELQKFVPNHPGTNAAQWEATAN